MAGCSGRIWIALAACIACGWTLAGQRVPLPYRIFVDVTVGHPAPPESLREQLELSIVDELARGSCFQSIGRGRPQPSGPDDLLLRVSIHDYEDETEHDLSIAARSSPNVAPDAKQRYVTRVEAVFRLELSTVSDGVPLRAKQFFDSALWRPVAFEDAREHALEELVLDAAKTVRKLVCKGSPKKWATVIEEARASGDAD